MAESIGWYFVVFLWMVFLFFLSIPYVNRNQPFPDEGWWRHGRSVAGIGCSRKPHNFIRSQDGHH